MSLKYRAPKASATKLKKAISYEEICLEVPEFAGAKDFKKQWELKCRGQKVEVELPPSTNDSGLHHCSGPSFRLTDRETRRILEVYPTLLKLLYGLVPKVCSHMCEID